MPPKPTEPNEPEVYLDENTIRSLEPSGRTFCRHWDPRVRWTTAKSLPRLAKSLVNVHCHFFLELQVEAEEAANHHYSVAQAEQPQLIVWAQSKTTHHQERPTSPHHDGSHANISTTEPRHQHWSLQCREPPVVRTIAKTPLLPVTPAEPSLVTNSSHRQHLSIA